MSECFKFPAELTIYEVQDVHTELIAFLAGKQQIALDLSQIDELDSAGIQLAIWLVNYCRNTGVQIDPLVLSDLLTARLSLLNVPLSGATKSEP
ncbi:MULTISPECIES: STAS domain-containing protein [unclassified Pseudoalteromonas]|uniref:STAS domain-containing protein n=1 Tax=unclassified Pseudoalteromonas TaxID=194690 RepID=UPI0020970993|nr:STAS domain-containing protein [Pseudoalteromonas sp. XMcav2-N]MCO7187315.1 STAS domain-containing protein [Pseudoalteromonas sp. XMcav2-N]